MPWIIVFWFSLLILLYHLILYPAMLWIYYIFTHKKKHYPIIELNQLPSVTVICPAYNEELHIEKKIKSFLDLDYPSNKIKMIVISDDSTDATDEIVMRYCDKNVELVIQKPRGGKQKAHNLVVPRLTSDYVLSTDANSIFDPSAVRKLINVIQSDPSIGIVSGELKLLKSGINDSGEGAYWKYECLLKKLDSHYSSIIGSNGSIFLIRTELFGLINENSPDDFERTLQVLLKKRKAVYCPDAIVTEEVTEKAKMEMLRKIRIITQEWMTLMRSIKLLNPFKYGRISFILFSHKVIRWLFFLFAFLMLLSSLIVANSFYNFIFVLQIAFYSVGILEIIAQSKDRHIPGTGMIAYLTAMVWASNVAFFKFLFNSEMGVWDPIRTKGK